MHYSRMPGAKPEAYIEVTIHAAGSASIAIHGVAHHPSPDQRVDPDTMLRIGRHLTETLGVPLYVTTADQVWNPAWGTLRDEFVERK